METTAVTDDILVYHTHDERAVLVRGRQYTTSIDFPTDRNDALSMINTSSLLTRDGLHTAILTREPERNLLPLDVMGGICVVRADRKPCQKPFYDMVPEEILRHPDVPVCLVRDRKIIQDDCGRTFFIEYCPGTLRCLSVLIEPEHVLVVADDLNPHLPPRVQAGAVQELLIRLRFWQQYSPGVIVPNSGIPIFGKAAIETLDHSVKYLDNLYTRMWVGITEAHFPWERLVYTIPWCDVWEAPKATHALVERHHANVRDLAIEVSRHRGRNQPTLLEPS